MKYIKYLDLPRIPENLLEPLDSIISRFTISSRRKTVSKNLHEWLQSLFNLKCTTQYQIFRRNLRIHKDVGRNSAFNYILDPGGENVITSIFDDDQNLIEYHKINSKQWHRLKTDMFHNVVGIETVRVSVSVQFNDYAWDEDHMLFWSGVEESNLY